MCWATSSLSLVRSCHCQQSTESWKNQPEIEVVNRALLVSHIYIEREQIDGWKRPPAEDLEQGGESVPIKVGLRGGRVCYGLRHFDET